MSEPRKLNTGAAYSGDGTAPGAERTVYRAGQPQRTVRTAASRPAIINDPAMEASRQAARQMAPTIRRAAPEPAAPSEEQPAPSASRAQAVRQAQERYARQRSLSQQGYQQARQVQSAEEAKAAARARQLQAMQQRAQESTASFARPKVQQLDLRKTQGSGKPYDIDGDEEFAARQARRASVQQPAPQPAPAVQATETAEAVPQAKTQTVYRAGSNGGGASGRGGGSRSAGGSGGSGKPPRGGRETPDDGGKGKKGKKAKKKGAWWKILLGTLAALILIFGATLAIIWHAISPSAGSITLSQLINTPKEFQGSELNVLIVGIDWEEARADMYSDTANDGMTDMIMYVHFDFVNKTVGMLQIPRNILVTDDTGVSGNYQINGVARAQNNDVGRLCELINDQFKLPIDGYISINMQSFKEIVDTFAPFEVYVPHDMSYGGSTLKQGYQTLTGDAAEFFVRNRKGEGYANSDLDRLNMQRYFYSALFRRMKEMSVFDIAKLTPVMLNYMQTSLPVSQLVSVAVSMLKIPSSSMMVCQMPVYMGAPEYNGNSVVVAARQEDAALLNQYFRPNTGAVDAASLGIRDDLVSVSGLTASDPNVQWMGDLNKQSADAQQTDNLDGSNTVTYVDPAVTADPNAASAGSDSTAGEASSPAA